MKRRAALVALAELGGGAALLAAHSYRNTMQDIEATLANASSLLQSHIGTVEYALAGAGPSLMMVHGTGGFKCLIEASK
jgi:2-hydroxy-6-oxonona-2,4-dienedioate hydrolase